MANWIPITIVELREARVSKLVDACSAKAKAEGQPDRAPGIIQGVINTIRRKIASHAQNTLDADPATIPAGLRDLAVDMIIARLKMAVMLELKEDERRALERAESELNRIADGKDTVEQPDVVAPSEAQAVSPPPGIRARTPRYGREEQEGV